VNRNQSIIQQQQQQQQQQHGLLIMQKLLGSMTSLLRREITPLMTSFPVVTRSEDARRAVAAVVHVLRWRPDAVRSFSAAEHSDAIRN